MEAVPPQARASSRHAIEPLARARVDEYIRELQASGEADEGEIR